MSDIDFDELDKAVNNLMGSVNPKDKEPEPNTVNINSTLDPNEKPSFDKLNDATKEISGSPAETPDTGAAPVEAPKLSPAPPMPRPRQNPGRFMDVVHPFGDMRSTTAGVSAAPTATVRPLSGERLETNQHASGNDATEPDPQTPFLPDANAKVSKRPLGAASWPFGRSSEDMDALRQEEVETNELQPKPNETVAINSEGEPERNKEELGLDELPPDPTHIDTEPTDEDVKLQSIETMEVEGIPGEDESKALIQKVESGDTENLRSDDDKDEKKHKKPEEHEAASGAIYDVKNYHQPLAYPPKQKSGWGTVIIILSIIVICVAIGAAVFFVMSGGL
jgi:hypothetical protein